MRDVILCTTIIDVSEAKSSVVIYLNLARIEPNQLLSSCMNPESQDGRHSAGTSYEAKLPPYTQQHHQGTPWPTTGIFK